jgi:hypothetical protein
MMHSKRMGESERVDDAMAALMRWKDELGPAREPPGSVTRRSTSPVS